jgi:hypothetical protein
MGGKASTRFACAEIDVRTKVPTALEFNYDRV